jgi:hypothetical protein
VLMPLSANLTCGSVVGPLAGCEKIPEAFLAGNHTSRGHEKLIGSVLALLDRIEEFVGGLNGEGGAWLAREGPEKNH